MSTPSPGSLPSIAELLIGDLPDVCLLGCDAHGLITLALGFTGPPDGPAPGVLPGTPAAQACAALGLDGLAEALAHPGAPSEVAAEDGRVFEVTVRAVDRAGEPTVTLAVLRDVTTARGAARELYEADQRFSMAFENAHIGMALIGADGCWLKVNVALCELTGYDEQTLLARTVLDITHPDDVEVDLEPLILMLGGELRSYDFEKRFITADGATIWVLWCASLIRDASGEPLYLVAQVEDITRRKQMEEDLAAIATHDALTGLWNRRHFEGALERQMTRLRRYDEPTALLLLDLNDFKMINDRHGHTVGDQALCHLARILEGRLRESDMPARLGGDEFVVLAPHTGLAEARALRDSLLEILRDSPVMTAHGPLTLSASIGIAELDANVQSVAQAIERADRDMYAVKATYHAAGHARAAHG